MDSLQEQRIAMKFRVKLEKFATETFFILNTAYGDVAMSVLHVSSGITFEVWPTVV